MNAETLTDFVTIQTDSGAQWRVYPYDEEALNKNLGNSVWPVEKREGCTLGDYDCKEDWIDTTIHRPIIAADGTATGLIREAGRKSAMTIFRQLEAALDHYCYCDKCDVIQKLDNPPVKRNGWRGYPNCECGNDRFCVVDEYLSECVTCPGQRSKDYDIGETRRVCVFPVTGGSEGNYIHIGYILPAEHNSRTSPYWEMALLKTFQGPTYATRLAGLVGRLLGA